MANTDIAAARWAEFIANRPEFPTGAQLMAAFKAGRITRLCDCGCNSFDISVPEDGSIPPLAEPGENGAVFEIEFRTTEEGTLEFVVLVGANGHLASIEVDYCANSYPLPPNVSIIEPPYHVRVSHTLRT